MNYPTKTNEQAAQVIGARLGKMLTRGQTYSGTPVKADNDFYTHIDEEKQTYLITHNNQGQYNYIVFPLYRAGGTVAWTIKLLTMPFEDTVKTTLIQSTGSTDSPDSMALGDLSTVITELKQLLLDRDVLTTILTWGLDTSQPIPRILQDYIIKIDQSVHLRIPKNCFQYIHIIA